MTVPGRRASVLATVLTTALLGVVGAPPSPAGAAAPSAAAGCEDAAALHVVPGDDLRRAVRDAGAGGTVCFGPGTYRMRAPLHPRTGQTLVGDDATLVGSRVLRGFRRVDDGWVVGGQRQQGQRTGTCLHGRACTFPDDVLRDGRPLTRVLSRDAVGPGRYWFDYRHDRIVVGSDPRRERLEALVAAAAFVSRPDGDDVTLRGFTVERFASPAQHGAVRTVADGWLVDGLVVRDNHGAGVTSTGATTIRGTTVSGNGQLGIGGTGADTVVVGNTIVDNGGGGFDPAWEAGGAKWAVTDGLLVEGNTVVGNHGPGLWTDIDALDTTYADNVVRGNDGPGIFHEISGSAVVRDNVVTGNGRGETWLWGGGVLLAGSHDVEVTGNVLRRNGAGLALVQQRRGRSDLDGTPRRLHDLLIADNVVSMDDAPSGGVTDDGYDRMFRDPSIRWEGNTWCGATGPLFWWDGRELDADAWLALGHDAGGSVDGSGCGGAGRG